MTVLPYIVAIASFLALLASLYKDRKLEPNTPEVKRALHIHLLTQAILVVLALWAAIDSTNSAKQQRIALIEAEATATSSRHPTQILDVYVKGLLPAATVIQNYARYQTSLGAIPSDVPESFAWNKLVSPEMEAQRVAGLSSFAKLQSIAAEVLSEKIQYGNYYPDAMTKWATRTLELKEIDLPKILSGSTEGEAYASLVGYATGASIAEHYKAIKRSE